MITYAQMSHINHRDKLIFTDMIIKINFNITKKENKHEHC